MSMGRPGEGLRFAYALARAELQEARACERGSSMYYAHLEEVHRLRMWIKGIRAYHRAHHSTWRAPSNVGPPKRPRRDVKPGKGATVQPGRRKRKKVA